MWDCVCVLDGNVHELSAVFGKAVLSVGMSLAADWSTQAVGDVGAGLPPRSSFKSVLSG